MGRACRGYLALALALCVVANVAANVLNIIDPSSGIVTPGSASVCSGDLFPDKGTVNFGAKFTIEYFGFYKVLTNLQANKKYVLYQRGCSKPTGVTADAMVEVPVTNAVAVSATFTRWLEVIGERCTLTAMSGVYTSSPCIHKLFESKKLLDFDNVIYNGTAPSPGYFLTSGSSVTSTEYATLNQKVNVVFADPYNAKTVRPNQVVLHSDYETTWQAGSEWGKFIAAFYNKEASVNLFIDNSRARWLCASKKAESAVSVGKKTALWVTIYQTDEGFSFASCPSKHCDLMTAAGFQVLDGSLFSGDKKDFAQVSAWAKDIDVLFVADMDCTYKGFTTVETCNKFWKEDFLNKLSTIKAVQNKAVYDVGRIQDPSGGSEYFISPPVEPDVLLADVVTAYLPAGTSGHNFVYLRNMITESVGNMNMCATNPTAVGCRYTAADLAKQCSAVGASAPSYAIESGPIMCPSTSGSSATVSSAWAVLTFQLAMAIALIMQAAF